MQPLTAGITKANTGIDGIVWNILGQTYVPKQLSENSFAWHAIFPPGTFVPPHIHPTQDEFIYMFEGRFDLMIDGKDFVAGPGDLIRLPLGIPHGSDRTRERMSADGLRPEAASGRFVDLFLREARGRGITAHDGLALLE